MSYSSALSLGKVAYTSFDPEAARALPFESLPESVQEQWARAGRNAGDVWAGSGPCRNCIGMEPDKMVQWVLDGYDSIGTADSYSIGPKS